MCLASNLNEDPQLSMCMVFPLKANHFEIDLKTWLNQGRWSTQGDLCISSSCWGSQWKLEWKQCSLNVPQFKSDYSDLSFYLRRPTETLLSVPSQISHQSPLNWRWLSKYDVHVRQSCNLVCKRVGNSWDFDFGYFLIFSELACGAAKTNFTDCLQIVYSWHSWWNNWWNSPDVKLLSNESYIFRHLHLFCKTQDFLHIYSPSW